MKISDIKDSYDAIFVLLGLPKEEAVRYTNELIDIADIKTIKSFFDSLDDSNKQTFDKEFSECKTLEDLKMVVAKTGKTDKDLERIRMELYKSVLVEFLEKYLSRLSDTEKSNLQKNLNTKFPMLFS